MDIQGPVTVEDGAMAMDGGSIFLQLRASAGKRHRLLLAQHLLPVFDAESPRPGRLYLDGQLVPIRSGTEADLLDALRNARLPSDNPSAKESTHRRPDLVIGADIEAYHAKIEQGRAAALQHLVDQLLEWVESDEYLALGGGDPP